MNAQSFIGTWRVISQPETSMMTYVSIERVNDTRYRCVATTESSPSSHSSSTWAETLADSLTYGAGTKHSMFETGANDHEYRICFWKHDRDDMVVGCRSGRMEEPCEVWSARRVSWSIREVPSDGIGDAPPPDYLNRVFTITTANGQRARTKGERVFIRELEFSVSGISGQQGENEGTCIYGIFYQKPLCLSGTVFSDPVLYDILVFDLDSYMFKSIFEVRTVRIDLAKDQAQIFATFDNRKAIPKGYFGNIRTMPAALAVTHNLFAAMPFESSSGEQLGTARAAGDPDSSCWGGGSP